MGLAQNETDRREQTNLRILEWMLDVTTEDETGWTWQATYISTEDYLSEKNPTFRWAAMDRQLDIPSKNLEPEPLTVTSTVILVRGVGLGLTHIKKLLRNLGEKRDRKKREEPEPACGQTFDTTFEIRNNFRKAIFSNKTSAICIYADMRFKARLKAHFKREYQNVELLFRQRP